MNHIRRTATVITGALLTVVGLLAAAPAAFAVNVSPGGSSGPSAPATMVNHGGMAGWEIILIALGAALTATVLTAVASRARFHIGTPPMAS